MLLKIGRTWLNPELCEFEDLGTSIIIHRSDRSRTSVNGSDAEKLRNQLKALEPKKPGRPKGATRLKE